MYQDIGLRNHQSIQRQGFKLVEKLKAREETKFIGYEVQSLLDSIETLFKAANQIVNR